MVKALPETAQIREWTSDFGREYTDRNTFTPLELDGLYQRNYGVTRTELNRRFLEGVPKDAQILEIGCNMGNQLLLLQEVGFTNLQAIEIQSYALERAKNRLPNANFKRASALALPYADRRFDLVFTSGVLIHIGPPDLPVVLDEIHRCAKRWIWGLEYYSPGMTEVPYRGHHDLLWKADYSSLYLQRFADLELACERRLPYLENENVDTMFLLLRKASGTETSLGQGEG